jgi:hypothetical protein
MIAISATSLIAKKTHTPKKQKKKHNNKNMACLQKCLDWILTQSIILYIFLSFREGQRL